MDEIAINKKPSTFGVKHSAEKWPIVAGGQTIYPKSRSNSKANKIDMVMDSNRNHNKDGPVHSLDIKIPFTANLEIYSHEDKNDEDRQKKGNLTKLQTC